jgi:hypothetical protein
VIEIVFCVLSLAVAVLVTVVVFYDWYQERIRARRLQSRLLAADRKIAHEHRQARRTMNDVAGQNWRNLAG